MAAACQIIVVAYDLRMGMILNQDEDNENHVSYKKVNSNSLFSGASIIWTSESQCLLTPFFVFFIFFHFTSAQQISGCRCGQEPVSLPVEIF